MPLVRSSTSLRMGGWQANLSLSLLFLAGFLRAQAQDCSVKPWTWLCPSGWWNVDDQCKRCPDGGFSYNSALDACYGNCPTNYRNDPLHCGKPSSYGRGGGYITKKKCESKQGPYNCEKWGLLYYPKCKQGFHNVACCVCSPDCPAGYTDIGVSCAKPQRPVLKQPATKLCPAGTKLDSQVDGCISKTGCSGPTTGLPKFLPLAHMTNVKTAVQYAMTGPGHSNGLGMGIEMDLVFDNNGQPLEWRHSTSIKEPCDCTSIVPGVLGIPSLAGVCGPLMQSQRPFGCQARTPAREMLDFITASFRSIPLIYIDSKLGDQSADWLQKAGSNVYNLTVSSLFSKGYNGSILISAPKLKHMSYLRGALNAAKGGPYAGRVFYTIDMEGYDAVINELLVLGASTRNVVYSYGTFQAAAALVCPTKDVPKAAMLYRQGKLSAVVAWTADIPQCWNNLKKAGATMIMTNFPQRY